MTTITSEALQHAYDAVLERLDIAGETANTNREIAYLFTAARYALEANQRLATLTAELAACRKAGVDALITQYAPALYDAGMALTDPDCNDRQFQIGDQLLELYSRLKAVEVDE